RDRRRRPRAAPAPRGPRPCLRPRFGARRAGADRRSFRLDVAPARGAGRDHPRADLAVGADFIATGRSHPRQAMPGREMRLAVLRRHQEQKPALVRDGGLRQPRQTEALRQDASGMTRLVAILALLLALASCAQQLEVDQARLCRMALPALSPRDAAVSILSQSEDADGRGVAVSYRERPGGRRREAHCRFRRPGRPLHSNELQEITLDGRPLGAVSRYFLIRFWLATPEGRAADPLPLGRIDDLPRLSKPVAYALQQTLNALPSTAVYALLAAAYSLIYGLIGRINFAFGALAAAGGYGAAIGAALAAGAPPGYVLLSAGALGVVAALGWGVASGAWALAPLRVRSAQQVLVATVGLLIFLSELLRLTQGTTLNWVSPVLNAPFGLARAGDFIVTTSADALFSAGVALAAGL